MARTYRRDARGRFAGGGPTGRGRNSPGAKASKTKRTNAARTDQLRSLGVTGMGPRLKAKGFAGGKAAQKRAGGLRVSGDAARIKGPSQAFSVGRRFNQTASRRAATKKVTRRAQSAVSKAGQRGKSLARTDKKAANPAQARYKELSKRIRAGKRYSDNSLFRSGFGSGADAAGARRSQRAMERRRRR